jgi:hypothetical protein
MTAIPSPIGAFAFTPPEPAGLSLTRRAGLAAAVHVAAGFLQSAGRVPMLTNSAAEPLFSRPFYCL